MSPQPHYTHMSDSGVQQALQFRTGQYLFIDTINVQVALSADLKTLPINIAL